VRQLATEPAKQSARDDLPGSRRRFHTAKLPSENSEGQLSKLLAENGVPFRYDRAESLQPDSDTLAGVPLAGPLLLALAGVLLVEQLVAYSASYHTSRRGPSAR
jgi:hypothetical protein